MKFEHLKSLEMHRRVRHFGFFMLLAKRANVIMVSMSESPEETKKLVAPEQIEHWPKFSISEVMNSEFMSNSES